MVVSLKMNTVLQERDIIYKKERDNNGIKKRSISCRTKELPLQKKNLYQVLSLESQTVGLDEVKKAYRVKALQLHPDVCPPSIREECTKQFVELRKAYEVISDPNSRRMYDNELRFGLGGDNYDEQKGQFSRKVWEVQLAELKKRSADRMERMNNDFM